MTPLLRPEKSSTPARPPDLPELRRPQRARVILDFKEGDEYVHEAEVGWAKIEGSWVLWLADVDAGDSGWQLWPMHNVVCVEWLLTDEVQF